MIGVGLGRQVCGVRGLELPKSNFKTSKSVPGARAKQLWPLRPPSLGLHLCELPRNGIHVHWAFLNYSFLCYIVSLCKQYGRDCTVRKVRSGVVHSTEKCMNNKIFRLSLILNYLCTVSEMGTEYNTLSFHSTFSIFNRSVIAINTKTYKIKLFTYKSKQCNWIESPVFEIWCSLVSSLFSMPVVKTLTYII